MKTAEHTAGPWEANGLGLVYSATATDGEDGAQLVADCDDDNLDATVINANARLISAAPDYHDAAQLVLDNWEKGDLAAAVRALAAAHAKARGS